VDLRQLAKLWLWQGRDPSVPHDAQDASEVHRCESLAKVVGSIHSTNMATTCGSRRETASCFRLCSKG
jgi:hypothetical protein